MIKRFAADKRILAVLMAVGWGPALGAFNYFDPTEKDAVPRLLSQTGIYTDISAKKTDSALKYFEVNSALWSDGSAKQRFVILPPGRRIPYVDSTDLFAYPDSTVFVKTFLLERVAGDTGTRVHWETRLLVNRRNAEGRNTWHSFSYRWNASESDAGLVDPDQGRDTLFHYHPEGRSRPQSYKKWHFPRQSECASCHASRHVLGFLPAQLKRPSPAEPGLDQVISLFNQGVFSGDVPTADQLARRWKSVHDPIPAGLTPAQRFALIDTMARSYIGANCSGCHGDRGAADLAAPARLNYDFHNLFPRIEFGNVKTYLSNLDVEDTANPNLFGRRYYIEAVAQAGLDTSAGAAWDMARPGPPHEPNLLFPGRPAYSTLLFRQFLRRAPWRDSALAYQYLIDSGDPEGWMLWMFSQPWGSEAWRELMAARGVPLGSVISYDKEVSGEQMPPVISSYLPDTAAMKILGEWVKTYRTIHVVDTGNIISGLGKSVRRPAVTPMLRGRVLVFPDGWSGPLRVADIRGRTSMLRSTGTGRFIIPATLPAGVYFFQAGSRRFKASLLE